MKVINPATGQLLREVGEHSWEEVEARLGKATTAFRVWSQTELGERATILARAAKVLRRNKARYASLMTEEMGKVIGQAESEVDKCAWVCEYYAEKACDFLRPIPVQTDATESHVRFDPLGVVLAVMPWNFPFWQVFRFAAPALAAGNVAALKHASNVPGCAMAIEGIFREAGAPEGVFQTLLIASHQVDSVIAHPTVAAVTLTGSESAGVSVASRAGKHLKKTVLELGGSDPFIVLEDAPLELAAAWAAEARCINSGQSCIAAKRFIVAKSVSERFQDLLVTRMRSFKVGDPTDPDTKVGPLARRDLVEELDRQVTLSVEHGARVLLGGCPMDRPGFFYPPTVVTNVRPQMPLFEEETFGPVAAVVAASDEGEAIELANRSSFGLGASLWTSDIERARRLVPRIQAGSVFVNGVVKSDPRLPFGGVKRSGYGRELSEFGMREFVNVKTVWIASKPEPMVL